MNHMDLVGSKLYSLDSKMRLTLPADYRRQFDDRVSLVAMPDGIYGFTPEGRTEWVNSMFPEGYNPLIPRHKTIKFHLNSQTSTVEIDSAGRISLSKLNPEVLKKLGRKVMVIGNGDHFEILSEAAWKKHQSEFTDEAVLELLYGKQD